MKGRTTIGLLVTSLLLLMTPSVSLAGWDISINIPMPGVYYYASPPIPVPGYYGYAAPVSSTMFYGGYWYRPSGGHWFIAAQFGGPWYGVAIENVPVAVYRAPTYQQGGRGPDGRYVPPRLYYDEGGRHGYGHGHRDD